MKILLFGKNGQVGWELNRSLQPLGEVIALSREDADFSRPENLRKIVSETKPDVIVNAVAYTAVDKAEEEEELAATINGMAPGVLAEEALKINALLVHYSTDYVFDGVKDSPYIETDQPNPVSAYGRTKLAGEVAIQSSRCDHLILRTTWVYASRGHNFLLTIIKLAKEREELGIVADQIGSPTTAKLIAEITTLCLRQVIEERKSDDFSSGIYHLATSGHASWCEFAENIVRRLNSKSGVSVKKIESISTEDYPTPAKRPMNSQLSKIKLEKKFNLTMPDWKTGLSLCIEELDD